MKVMVFDVGGTEIKYSVMDEGLNRTDAGSVPTPQDTQKHFLDTLYDLYSLHRDEVSGIAMALPGFVDTRTGFVSVICLFSLSKNLSRLSSMDW